MAPTYLLFPNGARIRADSIQAYSPNGAGKLKYERAGEIIDVNVDVETMDAAMNTNACVVDLAELERTYARETTKNNPWPV